MCSSAKSLRSIMFDWEPFKKRHLEICSDFGSHYLSNRYSDEHHIWHAHREHFCVLCDAAWNSYYEKWPNSAYSKLLHWAMAKNWGGCSEFLKNLVEHVSGCTYHFLTEWDINIFRRLTFKSPMKGPKSSFRLELYEMEVVNNILRQVITGTQPY